MINVTEAQISISNVIKFYNLGNFNYISDIFSNNYDLCDVRILQKIKK